MTDKEILEYGKQLAKYKSEIGTLDSAAPDLDEQVKEKFNADSVNRAKFIDATVIIGAATKEFRNVFGVDAPHYDLSDECYLAVDRNGNGRFFTDVDENNKPIFEEDELLEVEDPTNGNKKAKNYIDCWAVANAARFDSTMTCSNFVGDDNKALFVNKQSFFTDKKKDSTSSSVYNPVCPPGYDKWAGSKVYDKVCKCFELDELNLYRLFGGPSVQTISSQFSLSANGDDKFECNINEDGVITKNIFQYKYYNKDGEEDDSPLVEASHNGKPLLPREGCSPIDVAPIKWYKYRVTDNYKKLGNGTYSHQLNLSGSPFENSNLCLVEFELRTSPKNEIFNSGFAILTRNPNQAIPSEKEAGPGYYDIEYCVNILYRKEKGEGNLDLGDTYTYTKPKKFLWWTTGEKTVTVKNNYTITFSPIKNSRSGIPAVIKEKIARFIYNMENDCLKYYNWINERNLKNTIPNFSKSVEKMAILLAAAQSCINRQSSLNWSRLLNALKDRVIFDIIERDPQRGEENKILNFGKTTSSRVTAQYIGETSYISAWESNIIPGWPKWLRRLIKVASTPKYTNITKLEFDIEQVESSFINAYPSSNLSSRTEYKGPSKGDLTISHGSLITLKNFFDNVLTIQQKSALYIKGQTNSPTNPTKLYIGSKTYNINNSTEYEIILEKKTTKLPTYDNIKRAQTINDFMGKNMTMYSDAFATLADRINKRTGTLREMYSLLESTNLNSQMINQKKHNVGNISKFINTFEITGGFGGDVATIKLAPWEPAVMAYSNLERMGTVYIMADNTTTKKKRKINASGETTETDIFDKNYVKTVVTEIIDLVSDTEYSYSVTKDSEVMKDKVYYILDNRTGKYIEAPEEYLIDDKLSELYERGLYPSSGPVFKVTLSKDIPESIRGKNPILVKVYDTKDDSDAKLVNLEIVGDWASPCFTNEPVDTSGLTFKANYDDGSFTYVTPEYTPTTWSNEIGEQTVTFYYAENGITVVAEKTANVVPKLVSLEVMGDWANPCFANKPVDISSLTFKANYNNESSKTVTPSYTPTTWSSTEGEQTITFSYTENGITATAKKSAIIYQEVEYLESTGTQYINTGIKDSNPNLQIEATFSNISGSGYRYILGCWSNDAQQNTVVYINTQGQVGAWVCKAYTSAAMMNVDIETKHTVMVNSLGYWLDGTLRCSSFEDGTQRAGADLYLFKRNGAGGSSPQSTSISARIYSVSIQDNDTLVCDLVPCYRKTDNVAGMYDRVSGELFTNAGTGSFTVGPDIN